MFTIITYKYIYYIGTYVLYIYDQSSSVCVYHICVGAATTTHIQTFSTYFIFALIAFARQLLLVWKWKFLCNYIDLFLNFNFCPNKYLFKNILRNFFCLQHTRNQIYCLFNPIILIMRRRGNLI